MTDARQKNPRQDTASIPVMMLRWLFLTNARSAVSFAKAPAHSFAATPLTLPVSCVQPIATATLSSTRADSASGILISIFAILLS
jgi:hypothetical protein